MLISATALCCLPILLFHSVSSAVNDLDPSITDSGSIDTTDIAADQNDLEDLLPELDPVQAIRDKVGESFLEHIRNWFSSRSEEILSLKTDNYSDLAQNAHAYQELMDSLQKEFVLFVQKCMSDLSFEFRERNIPLLGYDIKADSFSWKRLAAICRSFREKTPEALYACFLIELSGNAGGSGYRFTVSYIGLDAMRAVGSRKAVMNAKFCTAYLNSVYDENGKEIPAEQDSLPEEYVSELIHPVPGGMIKNGWRLPRSNATRYHMGTDIKVNARTRIRSVTEGIVLYKGFMDIPGNYVVIRDPQGYEYHYYHMFNLSKFVKEGDSVKKGQVIGLVGNTGNSVANHLHLAIISPEPEYRYLNPYDIFLQAGLTPIRIDGPADGDELSEADTEK